MDLTIIGAQATGQGLDWIEGVEWITSGDGDDWLMGNDADNRLIGNDGRDSLFGGLGADSLQGDAGDEGLDGGEGEDWLVFAGRIDVWVNLSVTRAIQVGVAARIDGTLDVDQGQMPTDAMENWLPWLLTAFDRHVVVVERLVGKAEDCTTLSTISISGLDERMRLTVAVGHVAPPRSVRARSAHTKHLQRVWCHR